MGEVTLDYKRVTQRDLEALARIILPSTPAELETWTQRWVVRAGTMVESGISLDDVRSRIGFDAEVESIACKCAPDLPDNVVSGDLARFHLSESGLKLTVHRQPGRVSEERRIEASVPERWRRFQTVRGESLIAWTEPPARAGYVRRVLNEVFSPEEIARPIRIFLFSGIPLIGGYVLGLADVLGNVARSLGR